ncbi:MAG: hypothetical protein QE263_07865 [Vampirovibrionales bacterium]|nr:hypothetical protein [Vampirovibrionales bacterium]
MLFVSSVDKLFVRCCILLAAAIGVVVSPVANVEALAKTVKLPAPTSACETTSLCQPIAVTADGVRVVGALPADKDVVALLKKLADLNEASNKHSLDGVLAHFSPAFVSGDNLALSEVRQLIEQTWALYPDIKYQLQPVEIRLNGHWATVETVDEVHAIARPESTIPTTTRLSALKPSAKSVAGEKKTTTKALVDDVLNGPKSLVGSDNGELVSRSRGMLYLHRVGKSWEITSDRTLYETAAILFGAARNISVSLAAPDQVFSGQTYTAQLSGQMPDDVVAIASITQEVISGTPAKPEEKFRSLTTRKLERVFEANSHDQNELITATVGLTRISQDDQNRPVVNFEGLATLTKRVNVASSAPNKGAGVAAARSQVKVSANGKVDLQLPTNVVSPSLETSPAVPQTPAPVKLPSS